jgi:hypothetical protein
METKVISLEERAKDEAKSYLEELLSEGARKLLQRAIENEVAEYLAARRIVFLLRALGLARSTPTASKRGFSRADATSKQDGFL